MGDYDLGFWEGDMRYLGAIVLSMSALAFTAYFLFAAVYVATEGERETWFVLGLTAAGFPSALYGVRAIWRDTLRLPKQADTFN